MKSYRPARQLLAEVEQVLAKKYSPRAQTVEQVLGILQEGRCYSYAGVFLALEDQDRRQFVGKELTSVASVEENKGRLVVPIKMPGRLLGVLHVETDRANGFSGIDRQLLADVAARLAMFLSTNGRYIVFRAKMQPVAAEEPAPAKRAAAGEKSRS